MRIVLASESRSRRRAMDILGLPYEVVPSRIDEKAIRAETPERLVARLSEAKARKVAEVVRDAIVVAGDAVVGKAGRIFEKPADEIQAACFLREFSGRTIEFVSAVTVMNSASGRIATAVQLSELGFRALTDAEIKDYVQRYEVVRFAGAFEADGVIRFANHVSGSYNFATGVALSDLIALLREHGVGV